VRSGVTRGRIVTAARSAFSELGYGATTFQSVASRAALTRPAVNHYFANKQLLYRAVLEDAEALVAQAVNEALTRTDLADQLSTFVLAVAQLEQDDRTVAAFVVTAVLDAERHPELRDLVEGTSMVTRDFLSGVLNAAIERGELMTHVDVAALSELLLAVLWGVGFYVAFVGDHQESAAVIAHVHLLLSNQLWALRQPAPLVVE